MIDRESSRGEAKRNEGKGEKNEMLVVRFAPQGGKSGARTHRRMVYNPVGIPQVRNHF